MGAFIGIGLTYGIEIGLSVGPNLETRNKLSQELKNLIDCFLASNGYINYVKYSEDIDGELWKEFKSSDNLIPDSVYNFISSGFYGEISITSNILTLDNIECFIRVEKEVNYFGFLLDFKEEDILKNWSKTENDKTAKLLIDTAIGVYSSTKYDYAFCDFEAQFAYSPDAFVKIEKDIYSIVIFPRKCGSFFEIIKSNWNIDGHTERKIEGSKSEIFRTGSCESKERHT